MDIRDYVNNKYTYEILEDSERGVGATKWMLGEWIERVEEMFERNSDEIYGEVCDEARVKFGIPSNV